MLTIKGGKFHVNGERQEILLGVLAGKMANRVALGQDAHVKDFIDFAQGWLGREAVSFSTWLETGGWGAVPEGSGMFGAPPRDPGVWNVPWIQRHWNHDKKEPKRITENDVKPMYRNLVEWFYKVSAQTGCVFHLGIIATLKHTDNVGNGHMDHIIRLTLYMGQEFQAKYPKANVMFEACNEWDANNSRPTPFGPEELHLGGADGVQMWAQRRADQNYFNKPEHILTVSHGGLNRIHYPCSASKATFDAAGLHQERGGHWEALPENEAELRRLANGQPLCNFENQYFVTWPATVQQGWYKNPDHLNTDLARQIVFYENALRLRTMPARTSRFWDGIYFHADFLMQVDREWPGPIREAYIKQVGELVGELVGGNIVTPPKPRYKFERMITPAYMQAFGRPPDPGGLAHYNEAMKAGMTEAQMRESLIRSVEYDNKNPED